jgi:hypothetical protein
MRKTLGPRPWMTLVVVAIWVLAMVLPGLLKPASAAAGEGEEGWMVYTPNHPNACAPMPYDCYVILVYASN